MALKNWKTKQNKTKNTIKNTFVMQFYIKYTIHLS